MSNNLFGSKRNNNNKNKNKQNNSRTNLNNNTNNRYKGENNKGNNNNSSKNINRVNNDFDDYNEYQDDYYYEETPEEKLYRAEYAIAQIEYYFTVENLCRDTFLKQHFDIDGYVPLAFVCQFQMVAATMADYSLIVELIQKSEFLEYDTNNETIRLRDGWKNWLFPNADGTFGVPKWIKTSSGDDVVEQPEQQQPKQKPQQPQLQPQPQKDQQPKKQKQKHKVNEFRVGNNIKSRKRVTYLSSRNLRAKAGRRRGISIFQHRVADDLFARTVS